MTLDGIPEIGVILVVAIVLVPGFIITGIFEFLVPRPRRDFSKSALEFLGYSALHYILFSWAIIPHLSRWATLDLGVLDFVHIIVVIVLLPVIWPIGFVLLTKSRIVARIPGGRTLDPTAWDFFFSQKRPLWVIVRLRNGETVAGFYGDNSFTSAFPNEQELYLEAVYRVKKDGSFGEPVEGSRGTLIKGKDIHLLEFWDAQRGDSK